MKGLSASLIVVTIVAVMGIGWLINEIDFLTSDIDLSRNPQLAGYELVVRDLAATLDATPDKDEFLGRWRQQAALLLTLEPLEDFPLPLELEEEFQMGRPLLLEAEGHISIHLLMQRSEQVLSLVLPAELVAENQLRPSLILTLLFYIGVVSVILIWLYPLMTRLSRLQDTAQKFGRGDLSARMQEGRFSYIRGIEDEFNHMATRIQSLVADNKLLGHAVSHNLKTPLARLRFGIDALTEEKDEATREKFGERISRDLEEMEILVETLLQYARLDESNLQLNLQTVELNAFVSQLLGDSETTAVSVRIYPSDREAVVLTDPNYLAIQLNNLMGNALNYAKSLVNVRIDVSGPEVIVVLEDDGVGIPPDERQRVLEPFHRGSNSIGSHGHGMGLAIVARISQWLAMDLRIGHSAELGGAAVSLHWSQGG